MVFGWHLQDKADAKDKDANVGLGHTHGGGESWKGETGFEIYFVGSWGQEQSQTFGMVLDVLN